MGNGHSVGNCRFTGLRRMAGSPGPANDGRPDDVSGLHADAVGPACDARTDAAAFQNSLSGLDRVLDLLQEPLEMESDVETFELKRTDFIGSIEFKDVSFSYPGTDDFALQNVNLQVEPGETIALVGPSGAGKTTVCNLVARFYDPTSGAVLLDGINLVEFDVESYRRLTGIVEQDVFLFDGTIAENIGYANRQATGPEIRTAAADR